MARAGLTRKGKFEQSLEGVEKIGRVKPGQKPLGQRELWEQRLWAMSRVLKGRQVGHCGWRGVLGGPCNRRQGREGWGVLVCNGEPLQLSEQRHALLRKNRLPPICSWEEIEAKSIALIQTRADVDLGYSNSDGWRKRDEVRS